MNKEVKEICMKCELEFHKRGKGCAFRSLGNEYCDLIEDFNKSITNYQNQVEKLTQENNDLEERVIHQDNVINHLETWIKKQIEECNNYSKYIEKKVSELNARSSGKTYIANEIMKNEVAKKVIQEFLDKLNELRSKDEC